MLRWMAQCQALFAIFLFWPHNDCSSGVPKASTYNKIFYKCDFLISSNESKILVMGNRWGIVEEIVGHIDINLGGGRGGGTWGEGYKSNKEEMPSQFWDIIIFIIYWRGGGQESGPNFTELLKQTISLLSRSEQKILLDNLISLLSQNECPPLSQQCKLYGMLYGNLCLPSKIMSLRRLYELFGPR